MIYIKTMIQSYKIVNHNSLYLSVPRYVLFSMTHQEDLIYIVCICIIRCLFKLSYYRFIIVIFRGLSSLKINQDFIEILIYIYSTYRNDLCKSIIISNIINKLKIKLLVKYTTYIIVNLKCVA